MPKDLIFLTRFLHCQWKENIMKRSRDLRIILNVCLGISVNVVSSAIFEVLGKQFMYFYLEGGNQLIWCEVSANIFPWFLGVLKRKKTVLSRANKYIWHSHIMWKPFLSWSVHSLDHELSKIWGNFIVVNFLKFFDILK